MIEVEDLIRPESPAVVRPWMESMEEDHTSAAACPGPKVSAWQMRITQAICAHLDDWWRYFRTDEQTGAIFYDHKHRPILEQARGGERTPS